MKGIGRGASASSLSASGPASDVCSGGDDSRLVSRGHPRAGGWARCETAARQTSSKTGSARGARRLQADLEGAVDGFSHSLEIARRMVVKDPNDANWQRNLANGYQQIGEVCQAKGNLSAAADAFAKTVQIYENLASQYPSNTEWKHQLAGSWRRIGEVYQVQGNVKDAADAFAHVSQLTPQAPDLGQENPEWITNRCSDIAERISWKIRGEERNARGDLEGAAEAFLRSLQAAQRLASQDESDADWQRDLADGWQSVGEALEAQGDLVGAIDAFAHGAEISERLAVTDPDDAEAQRLLTVCSGKLAVAWKDSCAEPAKAELSRNDTKLLSKMVLER